MKRQPESLARDHFDVLVVGGGITGAFIAWDAALRGLRTALIEKGDFGGATSAASSKLLHGGVRYLQQAQLHKVRESAMERAHLQHIAPHHSHYVPFLVPAYRSLAKSRLALNVAMAAYEALCIGEKRIIGNAEKLPPSFQRLSRAEVLESAPYLDKPSLTGAVVLFESHMHSSERMTLSIIKSAAARGAEVCNYLRADSFLREGGAVTGVHATDLDSGGSLDIGARVTINAAGPWIPLLQDRDQKRSTTTGYARGAHLVLEGFALSHAVALPTGKGAQSVVDRGGRHVFLIPWRNRALVGTSYASYSGNLDELRVEPEDVHELLDAVNDAAPGLRLDESHIAHSFCGLYPLQAQDIRTGVYQGTGEYLVIDHATHGEARGLITALGAKYTTARKVAELAVNAAQRHLGGTPAPAGTRGQRCVGGDIGDIRALTRSVAAATGDQDCAEHLVQSHGTDALRIAGRVAAGAATPLSANQPVTLAEIDHILEEEMVQHLDDVVFRRTGLGTVGHPGVACLEAIAARMSGRFGWSDARREREIRSVASRFTRPGATS